MPKRKRVSSKRAVRTSMRVGNWDSLARASRVRGTWKRNLKGRLSLSYMNQRLNSLTRTIETKEGCRSIVNLNLAHNNLTVFNLNPFQSTQGAADPMQTGEMVRVGDQISVRGVLIKFFVETAYQRSNVHLKFFVVRLAKGDTLNRDTFFKGCANNKMIDQINTERFSVIASRTVRLTTPNNAPINAGLLPIVTGVPSGNVAGIGGTRIVKMWIPGTKFGRGGVLQYENSSTTQIKFYDFRICAVAYDWFGTPQDINSVGVINEGYVKTYFKDA